MKIAIAALYFMVSTSFCQTNDSTSSYFEIGLGLMFSSEYKDALIEAYSNSYDVSGAAGWVDLELGFGFSVTKGLYLVPKVRMLGSSVEVKAYSNLPGNRSANLMFLPGSSIRYGFGKKNSFHMDAFVSPVFTSFETRVDVESNGAAFGVELGMNLSKEYELGINFHWIPIKVLGREALSQNSQSADFGGFGIIFRRLVHLH